MNWVVLILSTLVTQNDDYHIKMKKITWQLIIYAYYFKDYFLINSNFYNEGRSGKWYFDLLCSTRLPFICYQDVQNGHVTPRQFTSKDSHVWFHNVMKHALIHRGYGNCAVFCFPNQFLYFNKRCIWILKQFNIFINDSIYIKVYMLHIPVLV